MLHIINRVCPRELKPEDHRTGHRPDWYDKRSCFQSLFDCVEESVEEVRLHVIYDGPKGEFSDFIETLSPDTLVYVDYRSNRESLLHSYEYASNVYDEKDDTYFYFVEDDYLHVPGEKTLTVLAEGLEAFDFVSLQDHPDRYTRTDDIGHGEERIFITDSSHWRTAESTTCTWGSRGDIFNFVWAVDPFLKQDPLEDREFFRRMRREYGYRLCTPIPGYSAHMHDGFMSPLIDWKHINDLNTNRR